MVLVVLALCAGCVGVEKSYPDKRYFVLDAPANPTPSNPSANETLQISNIRVSPRYADKGFVYRTSEAGYESDFYNQFLVSPASLITEEVRKGLTGSQVFKYVIGASNQSQPSYVLEGTVNALYGDFRNPNSPGAVLEMEFFLTSEIPGNSGILMQKRYVKSVPLAGSNTGSLSQRLEPSSGRDFDRPCSGSEGRFPKGFEIAGFRLACFAPLSSSSRRSSCSITSGLIPRSLLRKELFPRPLRVRHSRMLLAGIVRP